jgi:putative transposase
MQQLKAFKYRLIPDETQLNLIKEFCGCSRLVYNTLLSEVITQLQNKENIKIQEVSSLYNKYEFLKGKDSLALANAKQNLKKALNNFFKAKKGKRKGKVGFPKFKKKGVSKNSYTTNNQSGSIRVKDDTIKLPKLGFVSFKQHKPLEGEIRSATITINKDNSIEISILCLVTKQIQRKNKPLDSLTIVGLDMSMSDFCVCSDGKKVNYQREYRKSEKKRKKLNRSLHKKKMLKTGGVVFSKKYNKDIDEVKPSKNREKARVKLAKHERHIANKRKDYCHKLSRELVDNNDVIVLEDINLSAMSRTLNLGKSTHDLGFGMFRTFLEYKSIETDSLVVRVPKFYASSKICNHCKSKNELLKLSDRVWVCSECGCEHDRDLNASYNLRDYLKDMIQNTVGTTGIEACGDNTSTLRETLLQVLSLKQEGNIVRCTNEAPSFRWG